MTQRSKWLARRVVAAMAIVLATAAALIWIRSHHQCEAWYLKRPTSWWSEQLDKYGRSHDPDGTATVFSFDRIVSPPTPSRNTVEEYILSRLAKLGVRPGSDPAVDAILDPGIEAIPVLAELLQDRNRYVRYYAGIALGTFEMHVFVKHLPRDEVVRALEEAERENSQNEASEQIRCVLQQIERLKVDMNGLAFENQ